METVDENLQDDDILETDNNKLSTTLLVLFILTILYKLNDQL